MKQTKKKQVKNNSKVNEIKVLGIGHYQIEYYIELTDEDLKFLGIEDISNLNKLEDFSFLITDQNFINRFDIKTENDSLNTLLFMNKSLNDNNKLNIEYIPFETPIFNVQESEFEELFNKVNQKFNLNIINIPLFKNQHTKVKLTINNGDNEQSIEIGNGSEKDFEYYVEKRSSAQVFSGDSLDMFGKKISKGQNKQQKNENSEKLFDDIILLSKRYHYFICFSDDFAEINPLEDFIDFINNLKLRYGANIITNFSDTTAKFGSDEQMSNLNKIYLLTDTTITNVNDAIKNFNEHSNKYQTKQKKDELIKEKDIEDYYIHSIACRGALSITCSKVGFFLDDQFKKISMIEVPNNGKALKLSYDIKPYPKINHQNVELIEKYREKLKDEQTKNFYKDIFFGGLLARYCSSNSKERGIKELYPSYMNGCELLRRILDLNVNGYPLTLNQKFYIVKLDKSQIDDYIKKFELDALENKFVLDCLNVEKSKMKYYVPLFDYNLHEFFGSKIIQNDLLKKGFITNKGYVNYDPYYRAGMGVQKEKKKININKNEEILKKQIEKNEINTKEKIILKVSPTNKKLPTKNCLALSQMDNYEHQHVHRGERSPDRKCQYCILGEHSKFLEDIEDKKRKKMQLRRYDTDEKKK